MPIIQIFVRIAPGMWTCIQDGEFRRPGVRIQVPVGTTVIRGTPFMGMDVADVLEEEYRNNNRNAAHGSPMAVRA